MKFKVLVGILGILVLAGAVFGAYKFYQLRQAQRLKPCPLCPEFKPPGPGFCPEGTIIPGKIDECGCQWPSTCQGPGAFVCVDEESLNCAEEIELSFQCTEEYQSWARENCPGWEKYVCPEDSVIDCMPIIQGEKEWFCSDDYLDWAEENCPEFIIAY